MSVSQDSGSAWDVFHAESLELQRGLSTAAVRTALAGGSIRDDDLVRPAGTTSTWTRLADIPELTAASEIGLIPAPIPEPPPNKPQSGSEASPEAIQTGKGRVRPSADRQEVSDPNNSDDKSAMIANARASLPSKSTRDQLGGDDGDVSFPVLSGRPAEPAPVKITAPGLDSTAAPAWTWADDDEGEEDHDEIPS